METNRPMGFAREKSAGRCDRRKRLDLPPDFRHLCCEGMTGSGKTASVLLPLLEDRIARGHRIIFYAYKGNEHARVKALARRHHRLDEVAEFGKPHGAAVNLLELFDLPSLRKVVAELCGGTDGRDPYWANSAAVFAERTVEALRAMHRIRRACEGAMPGKSEGLFGIWIAVSEEEDGKKTEEMMQVYLDIGLEAPSFADLYRIVSDAKRFNAFFAGLAHLLAAARARIHEIARKEKAGGGEFLHDYLAGLTKLEAAAYKSAGMELDGSNAEATGNNGVRQVLENGIAALAAREYANRGGGDLLAEGKILVIDIEGLDRAVHGVLLESMLARLSARTRSGKEPEPVSVFIDEANRVLPRSMDLHIDVLRESRVELLLAYQNEEQMRLRFGDREWAAVRKNFRHRVVLGEGYRATLWREEAFAEEFFPAPLLLEAAELREAERDFNASPKLRRILERRFVVPGGLPREFTILYDPKHFSRDQAIVLVDDEGAERRAEYLGERELARYRELRKKAGGHSDGESARMMDEASKLKKKGGF